jgi:hypothetical protein
MQLNPMLGNTGIARAIPKSTAQALAARRYGDTANINRQT